MVGFYITGHPLAEYEEQLRKKVSLSSSQLNEFTEGEDHQSLVDGQKVLVGGMVVVKQKKLTKNNHMMAFITLEDLYGTMEVIVFPTAYQRYTHLVEEEKMVLVEGRLNIKDEEAPVVIADRITPLVEMKTQKLYIKISKDRDITTFERIKPILQRHGGNLSLIHI